MNVHWDPLGEEGQAVEGLDDVTRLDLGPFCRKMEPSQEAYYRHALKCRSQECRLLEHGQPESADRVPGLGACQMECLAVRGASVS